MTKDIILTISGLHASDGETDEPVELISPGQYFLKNGKHYILFDEVMEGVEGIIKSTIKFTEDRVELLRNGAASARMIFQKDQEHMTIYQTPMGPLSMSVYTEDILTEVGEEQMNLEIHYSLKTEGVVITESTVRMNICQKELKQFPN